MTATALELVITQLATMEATISGVAVAHDQTPESLGSLPAFINYLSAGEAWQMATDSYELHTIVAELFCGRGDLKVAESTARPYFQLFVNALFADPTLSGTCATVVSPIRYRYGTLTFAGVEYVGFRFDVQVKIRRVV